MNWPNSIVEVGTETGRLTGLNAFRQGGFGILVARFHSQEKLHPISKQVSPKHSQQQVWIQPHGQS